MISPQNHFIFFLFKGGAEYKLLLGSLFWFEFKLPCEQQVLLLDFRGMVVAPAWNHGLRRGLGTQVSHSWGKMQSRFDKDGFGNKRQRDHSITRDNWGTFERVPRLGTYQTEHGEVTRAL